MAEFSGRDQAFRHVVSSDLASVYDLYRAIEPHDDISADGFARWWRWLYADNPRRMSVVLGSFNAAGENVGHLALLPIDFMVDGAPVLACSACQLMVAESQRRTLLYPRLVKAFFDTYPSSGCEFCYAEITRPRVLAANLALGFRRVAHLPVYARPYRLEKLVAHKLGRTVPLLGPVLRLARSMARFGLPFVGRKISISEAPHVPEDFAPFLQAVAGQFKLAAQRTVSILNWRFTGNPDRGYRIVLARAGNLPVGYVVLRCMPMREFDTLAIVDLLFDLRRPDVGHALLRRAHQIAVAEEVDIAVTMLSEHSAFRPLMRCWGFIESPEQFTLVLHEPRETRHGLAARPPQDWHVTWFDHDFV